MPNLPGLDGMRALAVAAVMVYHANLAWLPGGGLYLFHWPIYQIMRRVAGNTLSFGQFATALAVTAVITEASYRLVETPIRTATSGAGGGERAAAR